jgi:DNA-binding MarR family transcriptional regulator
MKTTTPQIDGRDLGLAFQSTVVLRDRVLAKHGRSFPEFVALRVLAEGSFASRDEYVKAVSRNLLMDTSAVEALLDTMTTSGLVENGSIVMTSEGSRVFRSLSDEFARTTAQVYAGIDASDIATTRDVLRRVHDRAEALAATT